MISTDYPNERRRGRVHKTLEIADQPYTDSKSGDWLSWLERLVDIEEVTDSNSVSPTFNFFRNNLRSLKTGPLRAQIGGLLRGPLSCNFSCDRVRVNNLIAESSVQRSRPWPEGETLLPL